MECCETAECAYPLQGGGMAIEGSSTVTATACTISGNTATGVSRFPKILEALRNSPSPHWIDSLTSSLLRIELVALPLTLHAVCERSP
jgi:hypothetical protein